MKTYTEEEVIRLCREAEKRGALWAWEVVVKSGLPWSHRIGERVRKFADSMG